MMISHMKLIKYVFYILCCIVIITALLIFIFCLYRLQREANLLHDRKRDYVTHKINKAFPTIAILISIVVSISSILSLIAVMNNVRLEILVISIASNMILGFGLIVLGVIKLGFVHNILQNFPVDLERLLVDFLQNNSVHLSNRDHYNYCFRVFYF